MIAALLLAAATAAPVEGLLLGVSEGDQLATFFVTAASVERLGAGVAVPRKSGWWRGVAREHDVAFAAARAPLPTYQRVPMLLRGCSDRSMATLLFASSDFASTSTEQAALCDGDAGSEGDVPATRRLEDVVGVAPFAKGRAVDIARALGAKAGEAFRRATSESVDPHSWVVLRKPGRWVAVVVRESEKLATLGQTEFVELRAIALPTDFSGAANFPGYEAYARSHAGLTDAIASPTGAFVVEVRAGAIAAVVGPNTIASAPARNAAVVMTQWALGAADGRRWRKEAQAALK